MCATIGRIPQAVVIIDLQFEVLEVQVKYDKRMNAPYHQQSERRSVYELHLLLSETWDSAHPDI